MEQWKQLRETLTQGCANILS